MTSQHETPAGFCFDEAKSFSENCDAFLSNLERVDTEMAAILRDNWDIVVTVVREGERDFKARAEFNGKVAVALDSLVKPEASKDGK